MNRLDSIERTELMTILLDFYGEMLTERQRFIMQLYYNEDLSLSEIAEQEDITRQAVRDILVRSCAILERCEDKIKFRKRFNELYSALLSIEAGVFELNELNQKRFRDRELLDVTNRMYETIQHVKEDSET